MVALQTSCSWVFSFASLFSVSDGVLGKHCPQAAVAGGREASRLTPTPMLFTWGARVLRAEVRGPPGNVLLTFERGEVSASSALLTSHSWAEVASLGPSMSSWMGQK